MAEDKIRETLHQRMCRGHLEEMGKGGEGELRESCHRNQGKKGV